MKTKSTFSSEDKIKRIKREATEYEKVFSIFYI